MTLNTVEAQTPRPLVSFVLLTYNQEKFVAEAFKAALRQSYSPLEIIISDDGSADKTFEIATQISELYSGPHRIILNKNEQNIGITPNFVKAVSLSAGTWIVAAAGDDVSADNRVEVLMKFAEADQNIKGLTSLHHLINDDGLIIPEWKNILRSKSDYHAEVESLSVEKLMSMLRVPVMYFNLWGAMACWHRDLFQNFPQIANDRMINEDMILTWRAKMSGNIKIVPEKLVFYRSHSDSISNSVKITEDKDTQKYNRRLFVRSRASLIHIMADVDYASRFGIITEYQRNIMYNALADYILYQTAMINWKSSGFLARVQYLFKLWRPGKVRPGIRGLFERKLPD
jgi:glycosyltransferase involved in cell wall biosynthesis